MKSIRRDQKGFIPMMIILIVILLSAIVLVYLRVVNANN